MVDLFALLQDLGERIAAKGEASTSTQLDEDDPVESRFRTVLPTLLEAYFVPDKVKERELIAILKLLCHTIKHFPGVLFHGKGHAVLPIMGKIIPLFAEPAASGCHEGLFETLGALTTLLSAGDPVIFRQIFIGATLVIEDIVSVASFFATPSDFHSCTTISLYCFKEAYSQIQVIDKESSVVPSCWETPKGPGLAIDISGEVRWKNLADAVTKLIARCLLEDALHVEGLITPSFVSAVGMLLIYGDTNLHKSIFDLLQIMAATADRDAVPSENIIMLVLEILSGSENRTAAYDSILGACLLSLFSLGKPGVIESTAHAFFEVLPSAIRNTSSPQLKVALCNVFLIIVKHYPPYLKHICSLLEFVFCPELAPSLTTCIQLALEEFGLEGVTGGLMNDNCLTTKSDHLATLNAHHNLDIDAIMKAKRSKLNNDREEFEVPITIPRFSTIHCVPGIYASFLHQGIMATIEKLKPDLLQVGEVTLEGLLAALSIFASIFAKHVGTVYHFNILKQFCGFLPWFHQKGEERMLSVWQVSIFVEVMERLLFDKDKISEIRHAIELQLPHYLEQVISILLLSWSSFQGNQLEMVWKLKYHVLTIASKVSLDFEDQRINQILELGLKDSDACVRAAAIMTFPVFAAQSTLEHVKRLCEILKDFQEDAAEHVREAVAKIIGPMACIYDAKLLPDQSHDTCVAAKIFHTPFSCHVCAAYSTNDCQRLEKLDIWSPFSSWFLLVYKFLFEEPSYHVQVALISNISRLLIHSSKKDLMEMRDLWMKCLAVFPLHEKRVVREAFCSQIYCFLKEHVLREIVDLKPNDCNSSAELEVLGKLRYALSVTADPEIRETLMENVAEVAKVANNRQLCFFSIALLIEQLDHEDASLSSHGVKLLNEVALFRWPASGFAVRSMVDSVREELFEYLSARLINRSFMVKEFAEAVMCLEYVDLLKEMAPVVLPKLILEQKHNSKALDTLNEFARLLQTDLPLLLLQCCHKVLSFLLLRADGKELMAAFDFYDAQTGSDSCELFKAALPQLLDELVRFLGDDESEEALRRSARVAPMIQEVASIVTGSDDLPSFLRIHFVGLLNTIDRKLLRNEDLTYQKQAVRCIKHLLKMIGPYLNAFVPKLMALLTRAVQELPLQLEALHVWLSFVQQLAQVSPLNLKTVASQIMVALMPCLEAQEAVNATAVAAVLEELVVKNRNLLTNQVRELPLLPSLPSLVNVNAVLHEARGLLNLRDQLQQAVDGLGHESINVRYTTASELRKVMLKNRREIIGMVIGEVTTDTKVISSLVTALLHGCAEESRTSISQKFKMVCAECLGELGAIDPAKLNISLQRSSKIENNDEDFVFELVNEHLARVLRAATDLDVQDAAALAIQELLKLSGCQEAVLRKTYTDTGCASNCSTSLAEKGQKLWNRFSNDIKEIITPCLTSKYLLKNLNAVASSGPIFRPGMPFRRWIFLWIRWLVSQATGQRSNIFTACRGVVRHDMGTALYLLPSLVLDVVCEGTSEARTCIMEEILAVLADASLDEDSLSKAACMSWHGLGEVSIQTVFTLLDKLGQWLDECKQGPILSQIMQTPPNGKGTRSSRNLSTKDDITYLTQQCEHVAQLLAAIPKPALAGASFRCHAYARSLLYYESYVREKSGALNPAAESNVVFIDEDVAFLLRIYGGLDEPDGLSGLASAHKSTSLQDQFLINEKGGNWAEALTCCEQALQMEPKDLFWQSGVLDCLVNMGHLQAMVTHVDGLIARMPECKREWSMRGIQAAWRLGQWDLLDEYVRGAEGENVLSGVESTASFDHSLAKALQALRLKDQFKFFEQLTHCRLALLAPLTAASMESYTRAYPLIVKLHMLRELEDFFAIGFSEGDRESTSDDDSCLVDMADLVEIWDGRLRITQPLLWTREPILSLRRLVYGSKEMQPEVASCWLQYAKLCRTAGHYETANRAILQAQSAGAPNVELEKAKLYWDTKKTQQAIDELQQVLANVSQNTLGNATGAALSGLLHNPTQAISVTRQTQQKQDDPHAAKALLLLARWVHHTGQKQKEDVINMFSRVKELQPKWEKSYFFMARYFDDLLGDARRRQEENEAVSGKTSVQKRNNNMQIADDKAWWIYLPETILFYAKGLHKGHRHMFQALPRLLTLWFEFGTICESQGSNKALKSVHARVMSIMRGCLKDLPSYQWLTALPQLVSRICHRNEEIIRLVKHIITTVLQAYPQQALWTMAAVSKSTVVERREAAAEIIQAARNAVQKEEEKLLFNQFANLIEQMIRLCFCTGKDKARSLNISSEFGLLKRMMPVGVIMPVQRALTVSLPANGLTNPSYSPFRSGDHSTISGIKDEVEILASLQRPKKVVLIGSDGREYPFLCKPKDDLRKDARMMEFTSMINRLLSKDPNSRRRKLYIRTFAVIPLTEDCGMVEWVLHTRGFRHILQDLYVACGKFDRQKTNPMIKKIYDEHQNKLSSGELMRSKLLPMFPPIFHKWFLNMFPEPTSWFQARVAFAHTTAVWSMVGHIVGLGDRHGENILFDSTTGDCVHVDFSCLFDKGLQLERPELVPFRLTQNMIDGLGITGYEGTFLRVCEITLSILRAHRETLMSVLETFIHDPLVEWTKSHRSSGTEVRNPHAQRALANIQARLQGVVVGVGAAPSLPLSVEGQAHRLIAEAVSLDNLGRMYIWWMPWL